MNTPIGLNGMVKVDVMRAGKVVREGRWQPNLILDQGLDKIATIPIANLFLNCAAGLSQVSNNGATKTGNYNYGPQLLGVRTLTKSGSADDFVVGDVGKVIRIGSVVGRVSEYISAGSVKISNATHVSISGTGTITYLKNDQTGLGYEIGRSATLSEAAGENGTSTTGNLRSMTRTFVLDAFAVATETPDIEASASAGTVTRDSGAGIFTSRDIGKTLHFMETDEVGEITAIGGGGTTCTIDNTDTIASQAVRLVGGLSEVVTGTYKHDNGSGASGNLVTRVTGSRDFTVADIGKAVYFPTAGVEATITAINSTSVAQVGTSRLLAAQSVTLYGFVDVREIGFSDNASEGANLNMRVFLSADARVNAATPITPAEQLKVSYTLKIAVSPSTSTGATASSVISGGFNTGSASYVIETLATSYINADGSTNVSEPDLEPYYDGTIGLSTDGSALVTGQLGKVRDQNIQTVGLSNSGYVNGTRYKNYQGIFGIGQAVGSAWRAIVLYNPVTGRAAFTWLFASSQTKNSPNILTLNLTKSWDYNGNL